MAKTAGSEVLFGNSSWSPLPSWMFCGLIFCSILLKLRQVLVTLQWLGLCLFPSLPSRCLQLVIRSSWRVPVAFSVVLNALMKVIMFLVSNSLNFPPPSWSLVIWRRICLNLRASGLAGRAPGSEGRTHFLLFLVIDGGIDFRSVLLIE